MFLICLKKKVYIKRESRIKILNTNMKKRTQKKLACKRFGRRRIVVYGQGIVVNMIYIREERKMCTKGARST